MKAWNVVAVVYKKGFSRAFDILKEFGPVHRTDFFNVLVVEAEELREMMESLRLRFEEDPGIHSILSRVVPVTVAIEFQQVEEFEFKARSAVLTWASALAGKRFHVRMHRRGFKGRISSMREEQILDGVLLQELENRGTPGKIDFKDPDAVVVIEMVAQRAGLAFITREDFVRYPFLKRD